MKILAALSIVGLAAGPAFAWNHQTDFRGLEIYDHETGTVDFQIICDPNGAFIPPIFSAEIAFNGIAYEGDMILKTDAGAFTAQAVNGGVSAKDATGWANLVNAFRSSAEIELTAGDQTYQVNTGTPFPVSCGASD